MVRIDITENGAYWLRDKQDTDDEESEDEGGEREETEE